MNNNMETSRKLTFWELMQDTKIEIPIIQRDYAQGREEKKSIREKILNSFSKSIHNQEELELDFIYGSKDDNSMQPLDGQQRLTTLFLLHWYVACNENKIDEYREVFHNFTYETRTSSKDFCSELVNFGVDLECLLDSDLGKNNALSKTIINEPWFFISWEKDPTIKAMLIMLDAIHKKFNTMEGVWNKLTKQSIIKFNYIELKNFGLSDDLYIKMNARGKSLTDFENFKAVFERTISEQKWEENISNPIERFSHKVDTKWTDLLWPYRDKENLVDSGFLRLITSTFLTQQSSKDKVQQIFNHPNEILPEDFNQDTFNYLKQVLELYSSLDLIDIKYEFPFWNYLENDSENFFHITIAQARPTYPQMILFYAQTEFLLKNIDFKSSAFTDWMRVVRNIVYNSTVDSSETFIGAVSLIKELTNGSENIYSYLSENTVSSRFASEQVKEEIIKSKIIIKTDDNKKAIHRIEDTKFSKGRISFALYCVDYDEESETFDPVLLDKITDVFKDHFEEDDISNDFRRGLLTIKDNQFYNYWWSWLYAVKAPKRSLIKNIEDLKTFAYNSDYRDYLKEIVIELTKVNLLTLIESYIIPDSMPNWKKRIIKEANLLDYSEKHYIAIKEDDSCCWLIISSRVANTKEGIKKCKLIN